MKAEHTVRRPTTSACTSTHPKQFFNAKCVRFLFVFFGNGKSSRNRKKWPKAAGMALLQRQRRNGTSDDETVCCVGFSFRKISAKINTHPSAHHLLSATPSINCRMEQQLLVNVDITTQPLSDTQHTCIPMTQYATAMLTRGFGICFQFCTKSNL